MHSPFPTVAQLALVALLPFTLGGGLPGDREIDVRSDRRTVVGPVAPVAAGPRAPARGCEPEAPVALELTLGERRGGRTALRYDVGPRIDVADLTVELVTLGDARLVHHDAVAEGPRAAGADDAGHLLVDGDRGGLRVSISMRIPGDDSSAPWQAVERQVTWGGFELPTDAVTVVSQGEALAEIPALWRPAPSSEGGR